MSIELKEAAQQAIEAIQDLRGYRPDIDKAIEALRTAIQQVEAQQPATTEPVQTTPNFTQLMQILDGLNRCHSRDSKVEFLRSWIRDWTQHKVDKLTHPAPSVLDDVVRDAERYRWLRDRDHWPAPFASSQDPEPVRGIDLDAAIDAAMLAAKKASA